MRRVSMLVSIAGAASGALAQPSFFSGLGDLPGRSHQSSARAVSADGLVVVGYSISDLSADGEPFRWTQATGMTGLGATSQGVAYGVSADGSVIVGTMSGYAFRWTAPLGFVSLGTLPGASGSEARAVSADGTVVVGAAYFPTGSRPFRWVLTNPASGTGVMTALPLIPGYSQASAYGVSADGNTAIGSAFGFPSHPVAARWTGGTVTSLGFLPGGSSSSAGAVSAGGLIVVGTASFSGPPTQSQSFSWTEAGGMTGIGDPQSVNAAHGVSDQGVIVGQASCCGAFIWRPGRGMAPLKQVLEVEYGLQLTGWQLSTAQAITPDGRTIIGDGGGPLGPEGWIARLGALVCYANCDGSTAAPALNVADFTCFLQRFAAGDAYANCDNSTAPPVLNVGDFTCFLQRFSAGCP